MGKKDFSDPLVGGNGSRDATAAYKFSEPSRPNSARPGEVGVTHPVPLFQSLGRFGLASYAVRQLHSCKSTYVSKGFWLCIDTIMEKGL